MVGYTDMRRGIDGLAVLVQQTFKLDPFDKSLYLFCGRSNDRIKGLYWEGDGFLLLYKRLDCGRYIWPRNEREIQQITQQQLRWLLEGLSIEQPKAIPKTQPYLLT
jgi:transposase